VHPVGCHRTDLSRFAVNKTLNKSLLAFISVSFYTFSHKLNPGRTREKVNYKLTELGIYLNVE